MHITYGIHLTYFSSTFRDNKTAHEKFYNQLFIEITMEVIITEKKSDKIIDIRLFLNTKNNFMTSSLVYKVDV